MIFAGADVGKYQTRIVDGIDSKFVFPSRIIRFDNSKLIRNLGEKDFIVNYEGQKFFIGNLAAREGRVPIQYKNTSKVHFTTLINLLCGLHTLPDERFKIVINTPISNKSEKEVLALKKLVKGKHEFLINGEKRTIFIEDVGVWVEGGAGFFSHPLPGTVQGFDFGSTTTNYFYFEEHEFININSDTFPYGIENSDEFAKNPEAFMEAVYAQLSHVFKPNNKTMVMGGGYEIMFDYVKHYYQKAFVVNDPIFATAIGLYLLAVEHFG